MRDGDAILVELVACPWTLPCLPAMYGGTSWLRGSCFEEFTKIHSDG